MDKTQLEEELKKAAAQEWRKVQAFQAKQERSKSSLQKEIGDVRDKVESLKRSFYFHDPALRELNDSITNRLREEAVSTSKKMVCLECGDIDHGNRMNGQPWCMKCQLPLIPKEKADKWVKQPRFTVPKKTKNPTFIGEE